MASIEPSDEACTPIRHPSRKWALLLLLIINLLLVFDRGIFLPQNCQNPASIHILLETTYGAQVVNPNRKDQRIERSKQWLSMIKRSGRPIFQDKKNRSQYFTGVHEPMAEYG